MTKKRIGVVISKADDKLVLSNPYCTFISKFGTLVPVFALDDTINENIDLLVMPGGADISPMRYGEAPDFNCQNPNIQMEWFDQFMLPQYIAAQIPILGICRGFQALIVHYGGKMSQHENFPYSTPRTEEKEQVTLTAVNFGIFDSIKQAFGKNLEFKVNSLHHQGIYAKNFAQVSELVPSVIAKLAGNVEAVLHPTKPIAGVQWHPEEIYDSYSCRLMRKLLEM